MKKVFFFLALLPLFVACTNEENDDNIVIPRDNNQSNTVVSKVPSTNVFVQGSLINYAFTKADLNGNYGYGKGNFPKVNTEEGWEVAKFTIRIDASFPGVVNQAAEKYWSKRGGPNLGKVYTAFPWGKYDDRGLDYYKVDTKTGSNTGLFRYVLDPSGYRVNKAIMEEPDMKVYFEWLMGQSDVEYKDKLQEVIDNWADYKIIWYVAKEVGSQYLWHVNGILVEKDKTPEHIWEEIKDDVDDDMDISEDEGAENVEIDIHKQEHKDWNEIKTSIHVRADVENVQINIPIEYANIVEADDFQIRIYNKYISGVEIKNMIVHDENGITITIDNIDPELIKMLKEKFGDGLTVEIHSYCKKEDGVWDAMKKTTIELGKKNILKYQITSAVAAENAEKIVKDSGDVPVNSSKDF